MAVQPTGSNLSWLDQGDRLVLRLADRDLAHGPSIELAPGVREVLRATGQEANGHQSSATGWQTCCLEFDRAAGWDRPRASQWVCEHLGLRDLGRTIRLDTCYRMQPSLAALVSAVLSAGPSEREVASGVTHGAVRRTKRLVHTGGVSAGAAAARGRRNAGDRTHGRGATQAGHCFAGLALWGVIARAASRKGRSRVGDRLGRTAAPRTFAGRATRRIAQPRFRELFRSTGRYPQAGRFPPGIGAAGTRGAQQLASTRPGVAILALYPAQAELIRRLLHEDPVLAARGNEIEVGIPADFRQREAGVVFVSLTRSHTHRAVTFGERPQMLALALTRARSQLVLFGDPGTLWRRSQWEGPLEHLDEEAAAHERQLISRLVQCLQACAFPPTGRVSPLR